MEHNFGRPPLYPVKMWLTRWRDNDGDRTAISRLVKQLGQKYICIDWNQPERESVYGTVKSYEGTRVLLTECHQTTRKHPHYEFLPDQWFDLAADEVYRVWFQHK